MAKLIIDSMTSLEAFDVCRENTTELLPYIVRLIMENEKRYKRTVYAGNKTMYWFKRTCFERNGISYCIIPYSNGKSDYKKYGLLFFIIAEFTHRGNTYYGERLNNGQMRIFTNHFLGRYIERHLKDDSTPSIETLITFLMETHGHSFGFMQTSRDGSDIIAQTNIGSICETVLSPTILLAKTFVDNETIVRGPKKEAYEKNKILSGVAYYNKLGLRVMPNISNTFFRV